MASMLSAWQQTLRDKLLWSSGYFQGRTIVLPHSFSEVYALVISKATRFAALPLPLLSFLALPIFGGTSTSLSLLVFYLSWSSLVFAHDPLSLEIYGTLAVRLVFFLLPALGFLAFDLVVPSLSKGIKAYGEKNLPSRLSNDRLLKIAGVAIANVFLSVALQAGLEVLFTEFFHLSSILKVTATVPLPWNLAREILKGLVVRGLLHYYIHRFLLHTYQSPLKTQHLQWQHSVRLPFSLAAAYDHPIAYQLANFLPDFLPAYIFRFHVLTWHLFVALTSLETLFINSGYAVLPSSIVLAGMARRTDAHFITAAASDKTQTCNFGHWGIMDFISGTNCKDTASVFDDLQDEAQKHRIEERAQKAARGALDGLHEGGGEESDANAESDPDYEPERDDAAEEDSTEVQPKSDSLRNKAADASKSPAKQAPPVKRRSGRRVPQKD
ncbi:hypothetical protein Q7P37_001139 [Cladosporium fusiforme]